MPRKRTPRKDAAGNYRILQTVKDPKDGALFAGDLPLLLSMVKPGLEANFKHWYEGFSLDQIQAAFAVRGLLHIFHEVEGWCVTISRWVLQAASSSKGEAEDGSTAGKTMMGHSRDFFGSCSTALDPPMPMLIERSRVSGVVRRTDMRTAVAQCAQHHGLLESLVSRGARVNEATKFGWTALHLAAAFGAPQLVQTLLALGANTTARTVLGHTPLYVAATHGGTEAATMLAATLPMSARSATEVASRPLAWSAAWLDNKGRSPDDAALFASGADVGQCAAMLRALQAGLPPPGTQTAAATPARVSGAAKMQSLKLRTARCEEALKLLKRWPADRVASAVDAELSASWKPAGCMRAPAAVAAAELAAELATAAAAPSTNPRATAGGKARKSPPRLAGAKPPSPPPAGSCDFPVVDASEISTQDVVSDWVGLGAPVLVRGAQVPEHWRGGWSRRELQQRLGSVPLRLEMYPYAEGSATIVAVAPNRTRLKDMLEVEGPASIFQCEAAEGAAEGAADGAAEEAAKEAKELAKEAKRAAKPARRVVAKSASRVAEPPKSVFMALKGWAFVGRDSLKGEPPLNASRLRRGDIDLLPVGSKGGPPEGHRRLLEEWERPSFIEDESDHSRLLRTRSVQFYVGGAGAGAQHHWHESAWNWLARGRKRWLLWPPEQATYAQRHISLAVEGAARVVGPPLTCEQRAGGTNALSHSAPQSTLTPAPPSEPALQSGPSTWPLLTAYSLPMPRLWGHPLPATDCH